MGISSITSLIDLINLGLALVSGMQEELGQPVGGRYTNIAMTLFNLILPKAGPAIWLSFLGFSFGSILTSTGFTRHWAPTALCRAILKTFEAGFLPSKSYFAVKCVSGKVNNSIYVLFYPTVLWYWLTCLVRIFVVEDAITCGVCLLGTLINVDFLSNAGAILPPEEKEFTNLAAVLTYISGCINGKHQTRGPGSAVYQAIAATGMLITAHGKAPTAR
ncbi:unnamed protein product [Clonostachys byssicola]|uniref:Uncharacterized protein n=1 Tax=Clonostachys byssicola TaxID=160290 RepID=A0A9N9XW31_9HYPO|nr:unnamed protein product [Clonostachys byssicola]